MDRVFTEEDWTVLDNPIVPAYPKSKTIAERAAWDWIAKEGGSMELAVVNPVGIWGPVVGKDASTSVELILRMMNGQLPGIPNVGFGCVDVRDVADLHLMAMTDPKAAGQRFIAVSDEGFVWAKDIALKIKARMGDRAKRVPTRVIPDFVLKIAAWFDSAVGLIVPELGKEKNTTNKKAKEMLGWRPRSAEDALVSNAESLYRFGMVK